MGLNLGRARRGHLSTKVAGAKNRPAPPGPDAESADGNDDDDDQAERRAVRGIDQPESDPEDFHDPPTALDRKTPPLAGLVVSFTGIPVQERDDLASRVRMLGAETQLDLTHTATHLVSLKVGSEKYRRATENGMAVVSPEWIKTVLACWLEGRPFDSVCLTDDYLLRPMEGLKIGIVTKVGANSGRLQSIVNRIETMGAVYVPPGHDILSFRTTHLVFLDNDNTFNKTIIKQLEAQLAQASRASPTSPDKFRARSRAMTGSPTSERASSVVAQDSCKTGSVSGSKRHAGHKLPIFVQWQWVVDCQHACVCVDEQPYSPDRPNPTEQESASYVALYKDARREAAACVRRRVNRAQSRSGDTLAVRQRRRVLPPASDRTPSDLGPDRAKPPSSRLVDSILQNTLTAAIQPNSRSGSKWDDDGADDEASRWHQKRRIEAAESTDSGIDSGPQASTLNISPVPPPRMKSDIPSEPQCFLEGVKIRIHPNVHQVGPNLHHMLTSAGAVVVSSPKVQVDYSIVPQSHDQAQVRPEDGKLATYAWLEASRWARRRIADGPEADDLDRFYFWPTKVEFPIAGADEVSLNLTAFRQGPERRDLLETAIAIGMQVTEAFNRDTTHLVVGSEPPRADKLKAARNKHVHVVDSSFVKRAYIHGIIDPPPAPRPERSFHLSQLPDGGLLPSTAIPPTCAAGQGSRMASVPPPSRSSSTSLRAMTGSMTSTQGMVQQMCHSMLSDPNKATTRRRARVVARPRQSRSPSLSSHAATRTTRTNKELSECPAEVPDGAIAQLDGDAEFSTPPPQTQVFVSYANPRAQRERERLEALLATGMENEARENGGAGTATRAVQSAPTLRTAPGGTARRRAGTDAPTETIDLSTDSPPSSKRTRRTRAR